MLLSISFPFRLLSSLAVLSLTVLPEAHALWPQPRNLQTGPPDSALRLAPSDSFSISLAAVPNAPADLSAAAERTHAQLFNDQLGRLVLGRGTGDLPALERAPTLTCLVLQLDLDASSGAGMSPGADGVRSIEVEARKPLGHRDEAYSLSVPADGGQALLRANSTLGLFRGLNTFSQLWYTVNGMVYMLGVPLAIQDSPAYVCAWFVRLCVPGR